MLSVSRRQVVAVFACFSLVLASGIPCSSAGDKAKDKETPEVRGAIIEHLRKLCASDDELRGSFIAKDGKDDKAGALVLRGFIDNEKQRPKVAAKAKEAFKTIKAWSDAYPGGVDISRLVVVPVRSTLLAKIKNDLAADGGADAAKEKILTRVRLDDVYCPSGADELAFTGVCIAPGADADADGIPLGHAVLKKALTELLRGYALNDLAGLGVNVTNVKLLKNPVVQFQEKFTRNLGIDTVFFQDARFTPDGTLHLSGLVAMETSPTLAKLFAKHLGDHPAVAGPSKLSLDKMKAIPWPISPRIWSDRIALAPDHRRTVVMRAYPHYFAGDLLGLLCEAYYDSALPEKEYKPLLENRLRTELGKDWPAMRDLLSGKDNLSVELKNQGNLKHDLQAGVVKKLKLNQVWIEDVRIDAAGMLQVSGLISKDEERKLISGLIAEDLGRAFPKWSVDKLTVEDWQGKLATIQARMMARAKTEKDAGLFEETRLDKIFFGYNEGFLETRYAGLTFHDKWDDKKLDFRTHLIKETLSLWPGFRDLVSIDDIKAAPRPDHLLQAEIGKTPALDGVFIEKATFDKDGKLVLEGLWRSPEQEKALRAFVDGAFKDDLVRPQEKGLVLNTFKVVRTDQLLRDLQRFAAENLEDVRVIGIYFNKDGSVRLRASVREENAKEDIKRLRDEFDRLKKYLPGGKTLKLSSARFLPALASLTTPARVPHATDSKATLTWVAGDGDEVVVKPSLARHLREKVLLITDPYWDGVLIERGFFDKDGRYTLIGLVDNDKQRESLREVLRDLAKLLPWSDTLEKEPNLDGLKKLELAPMRKALEIVMPEYPEFDYLRIDRIYHTYELGAAKKKLTFAMFMAEPKDDKDKRLATAKALLASLIGEHPIWKARLVDGVEIKVQPTSPDEKAARLALGKAIDLVVDNLPPSFTSLEDTAAPRWVLIGCTPVLIVTDRKPSKAVTPEPLSAAVIKQTIKYLDVTLLHYPEDSTAWFLRAAMYLASGDKHLAARDLRRLNKVEFADPGAKDARLAALDLFQGVLRIATSDLAADERIDSAGGRRLWTLRDVAALAKE